MEKIPSSLQQTSITVKRINFHATTSVTWTQETGSLESDPLYQQERILYPNTKWWQFILSGTYKLQKGKYATRMGKYTWMHTKLKKLIFTKPNN